VGGVFHQKTQGKATAKSEVQGNMLREKGGAHRKKKGVSRGNLKVTMWRNRKHHLNDVSPAGLLFQ